MRPHLQPQPSGRSWRSERAPWHHICGRTTSRSTDGEPLTPLQTWRKKGQLNLKLSVAAITCRPSSPMLRTSLSAQRTSPSHPPSIHPPLLPSRCRAFWSRSQRGNNGLTRIEPTLRPPRAKFSAHPRPDCPGPRRRRNVVYSLFADLVPGDNVAGGRVRRRRGPGQEHRGSSISTHGPGRRANHHLREAPMANSEAQTQLACPQLRTHTLNQV